MDLRLTSSAELRPAVETSVGAPIDGRDGIAEIMRAELTARRACSGKALRDRIASILSPMTATSVDLLDSVLTELLRRGDATDGPGGMVAAAPLRFVDLSGGRFRIFGGTPTNALTPLNELLGVTPGIERIGCVKTSDDAWRGDLAKLGGIVIAPERWAGLDRILPAGAEWLQRLDRLLVQSGSAAGSGGSDLIDEWRVYRADSAFEQRRRWREQAAEPGGHLWRSRHQRGWRIYAWTAGGPPSEVPSIRLGGDGALRTMFSVDRVERIPATLRARQEEKSSVLFALDLFLPRAEYRYVVTMADRVPRGDEDVSYRCSSTSWELVRGTLEERLGLVFELSAGVLP